MMGAVARQKLFLIDTFGFIFRAYHARARSGAPPMRTSTGFSTEAVYIFNNMLRKLSKQFSPTYIAAVFESSEPTHRVQEFAEYKANRTEMPPDLSDQIPFVRRVLEAMRIPILEYPGFEADDVIGTLARRAEAAGLDVVIVSSDKDMLQLVTERVAMLNPAKDDEWYDPEKVKTFLGVRPDQVADLIREALKHIPPERLIISSDCGMGREGMSRRHATYKMVAMVLGTNIVRKELGLPEAECLAADPRFSLARTR